ncbi:MAG: hypothetical protein WCD18_10670, partial [Thermosynechococcaceae cyanobacterium]
MSVGVSDHPPAPPIRLVLIGSDPIFQLGLQTVLESDETFRIIGTVQPLDTLWAALNGFGVPDIFLFDLDPMGLNPASLLT